MLSSSAHVTATSLTTEEPSTHAGKSSYPNPHKNDSPNPRYFNPVNLSLINSMEELSETTRLNQISITPRETNATLLINKTSANKPIDTNPTTEPYSSTKTISPINPVHNCIGKN